MQNVSTVRSAGDVKVDLVLPGRSVVRELGAVEAGQVKEAEMSVSGLDPLELIKGIDAEIQVTMNDRFMSDGKLKFVSADAKRELASYFDQLIKGRGLIPANMQLEDRNRGSKKNDCR